MKKLFYLFVCFLSLTINAQTAYFFDKEASFDPIIPSPEKFLGYEIGALHTRHDAIVSYFNKLAELSDRAVLDTIGHTYEHRQLVVLRITSPENQKNIDQIQKEHLKLVDPKSENLDYTNQKPIILLGYGVHGNEPSSAEAALLTAYYYVAGLDNEVTEAIDQGIILIDPTFNPDGRDRHTTWANSFQGNPLVSDPLDAEHNEMWPRGRTNHYWFDLNRDWLPLAHIESQSRINFYHKWYPNVVTDFHEMGTNATYFFEPTKPYGSENPVIPRDNYDILNVKFAEYFSEALDGIGSLYFTKEQFDNSYPGYGSTYPDMHGALGLVFEQASSRGHLQDSRMGPVSFAFTIKNHFTSSKATVRAAIAEKELLAQHLHKYFETAVVEGKSAKGGWSFGDQNDEQLNREFLSLLSKHKVKVQQTVNSSYPYYVSNNQAQYRMVRTLFEPVTKFHDSVFYDASAWTVALAYNMPHERVNKAPELKELKEQHSKKYSFEKSTYAYIIPWDQYNSAHALNYLLEQNLYVNTAFKPFQIETADGSRSFSYGTLMIPVKRQAVDADQLYTILSHLDVPVFPVSTGYSKNGIDLGSANFKTIQKPKALMLIGGNTSSYEAGEVWFLADTKLSMPITKVMMNQVSRVDWSKYNTLILVSGNYDALDEKTLDRIKLWVEEGGSIISQRSATAWLIKNEFISGELMKNPNKNPEKRMDYVQKRDYYGSQIIGGSIYKTTIDRSHPLAFGYTREELPVYRNHSIMLKPSKDAFSTVVQYTENSLLSGYVNKANLDALQGTASLVSSKKGRGTVVLFIDNPNFRGMWYGTNRLFFNSLFFSNLIY